nr:hypothetical protein [Allomuricauda sp.]
MENCLDCSCLEPQATLRPSLSLKQHITKFLTSFVIEGAEYLSKTK